MRLLALTPPALTLASAGALAASGSPGGASQAAKLKCKQSGIHFYGAAAGKAKVCFTLTANKKKLREFNTELCPASGTAGTPYKGMNPVAVKANGSFSATRTFLTEGSAGLGSLGFTNVTLSGRLKANKASGTLVMVDDQGQTFKCGWSAHRLSS